MLRHTLRVAPAPARSITRGCLLLRQQRRTFFPGPYEIYNNRPTVTQRIWRAVPAPLKALGLFTGSAAVLFFIATPLLLVAGPPVALGVWWYGRKLRKMQNDLYNQRWSNMGSYHLSHMEDEAGLASGRLPSNARDRIIRALENNEQGVASRLGYESRNMTQFKFTPVESIHQDFKGSPQGFQEEMEVSSYGLLDQSNQRVADVVVVSHRASNNKSSKLRIELTTIDFQPKRYILENDSTDEDIVIEVKGH